MIPVKPLDFEFCLPISYSVFLGAFDTFWYTIQPVLAAPKLDVVSVEWLDGSWAHRNALELCHYRLIPIILGDTLCGLK